MRPHGLIPILRHPLKPSQILRNPLPMLSLRPHEILLVPSSNITHNENRT